MADGTDIEWTDATWNPVRGCSRVSEGCRNCYAETIAARFSGPGQPYEGLAHFVTNAKGEKEARWTGKLNFGHNLDLPLRWQRPRRIFVNSTSDLFHEGLGDEEIATVYGVAIAAVHLRGHVLQILTKRPERMRRTLCSAAFWEQVFAEASMHVMERVDSFARRSDDARATLRDYGPDDPPAGIWLGVSVEDQERADARIPLLLDTPSAVRFVSLEPLLGPIHLGYLGWPRGRDGTLLRTGHNALLGHRYENGSLAETIPKLDWVIVGGESGRHARPMHPDWARSIRDQCEAAGVSPSSPRSVSGADAPAPTASGTPFFFKQWGEWAPGECATGPARRTEQTATWFGGGWRFGTLTPATSEELHRDYEPNLYRLGKRAAGRMLDGVEHNGMPSGALAMGFRNIKHERQVPA